jgi:hypothetical protein
MTPQASRPLRLPTLADLDPLPPGIVGEIIKGVLYTMTKPRMPHQLIGLEIGSDLLGPFGKGREHGPLSDRRSESGGHRPRD